MSKVEYLGRLRYSLEKGGLGAEDIEDALRYYEEIFLDAGEDREEETAKNLGLPEDLARGILIDNGIHADGEPTYPINNGYNNQTNNNYNGPKNQSGNGSNSNTGFFIKLLLICLTFPIWLPIIAGVGGVGFGLLVAAIAVVFSFVVVGITCTAAGIITLFKISPVGLAVLGVGLVFTGLSGLILWPICRGLWHLIVKLVNWIVSVVRKLCGIGGARVNG